MSLSSMNPFSPVPLAEGVQDQSHLPLFTLASDGSSCLCPILFDTSQERGANHGVHHLSQHEPNEHLFIRKSSDHLITFPTSYNNNTTTTTTTNEDDPTRRKIMNSNHVVMSKPRRNMRVVEDRVHPNQNSSMRSSSSSNGSSPSGFIIRVCSDCSTTKTPLWRSGPRGPKSLCNACGIRQRKARRAMDTAAAAGGGLIPGGKVRKERRSVVDRTIPFKKRCKNATTTATQNKKLCFDDVMVSLSKSSAVHRVFPQDERDAALLLMALSWGIVCS